LTTAQLLVLRSLASVIVMLFIINFRVKHYMYDKIPRQQYFVLFLRVSIGLFNMFCQYYSIKNFPLVFVSLVQNLAPLLVALASFVLYKLPLTRLDTSVLLVSFFGVILLVTGGARSETISENEITNVAVMVLPILLFLLMPVNECSI